MSIEPDDIMFQKAVVIGRCLDRIREEYNWSPALDNPTHVDAMVLNIERACQAAMDIAAHIVARHRLGIPRSAADTFEMLYNRRIIDRDVLRSMQAMTGFRNIAVHQYQDLDKDILRHIATRGHRDFVVYCKALGLRVE